MGLTNVSVRKTECMGIPKDLCVHIVLLMVQCIVKAVHILVYTSGSLTI